jgi:hypothetical protein
LVALIGTFIIQPNPLILLIAIIAIPQVWAAWKGTHQIPAGYYAIPNAVRYKYLAQYLALVGLLVVMSGAANQVMTGTKP